MLREGLGTSRKLPLEPTSPSACVAWCSPCAPCTAPGGPPHSPAERPALLMSFNPLGAFTSAASAASYVAGAAYDGLLGAATTPSTSSTAHAGGKGISVEED
eukprot:g29140.t1